jgi:F-type H+-transporting ATPase subunit b
MPQLDYTSFSSQLFWLVVVFLILYIVLTKAALPGVREVLQSRQDRIASDLDKAEAAQKEAEKVKASYTDSLDKARHKAVAVLADASAVIQKEMAIKNGELDLVLAKKMDEADHKIAALRTEVSAGMAPVAVELSQVIVEKLLHKTIDIAAVRAALK